MQTTGSMKDEENGAEPDGGQSPGFIRFSSSDPANLPELSEKKYRVFGLLIILFALFLRFFHLGERVFHHDESIHSSLTLKLLEHGQYSYDPAYHGPFLYHSTALVFHFLGINDSTARLLPVLFGTAAILVLFLLKKELGKRGVLWSAFLLAASPSMVYFSRFFRNDMIIVFCTIAAIAGGVRYLENLHSLKRYPYLILAVSALALAVTAKENAYLIILIFGSYAGLSILYGIYSGWRKGKFRPSEPKKGREALFKSSVLLPYIPDVLLSGALFIFIVMLFYTSLFRNPESLFSIVERAFSHWMAMHRTERIGGPFYYYFPLLLVYEIPVLLFGTAGFLHFLKKRGKNSQFFLFLCYWALASLLLYSYLQEKVPWLVVHIILPFGILAGAYLGEMFPRRLKSSPVENADGTKPKTSEPKHFPAFRPELFRRSRTILAGVLALTLVISLVQGISVNYYRSMEPAEPMTYTQASPDIRELIEKIDGLKLGPKSMKIYVVDPKNLYWPLPWYLRDYEKTGYMSKLPMNKKYDAIIVPAAYQMYREIPEEDYASYNFTLRPGKEFTLYYKRSLERAE
ncbi:flippase activity-associated protein Agl23 [Methanosarcina sp. KYL-1]|uniref:flippase activity-associated protein Agl23 n=1 Tax=Methanosarcina sp. KYL-1 TaxID=2602068 RepID=UPI0021011E2A|nr:flippase activity-associated protein Agl23 [Methanosarcina sp. KYL-1]